jgi:hypothetical protein
VIDGEGLSVRQTCRKLNPPRVWGVSGRSLAVKRPLRLRERIPLSSVDRNPADLARAGGDSGPELRSLGRRRTDGGTHPVQPSDPSHLLGVGRPSEAAGCRGRARWFYSSSLVC